MVHGQFGQLLHHGLPVGRGEKSVALRIRILPAVRFGGGRFLDGVFVAGSKPNRGQNHRALRVVGHGLVGLHGGLRGRRRGLGVFDGFAGLQSIKITVKSRNYEVSTL